MTDPSDEELLRASYAYQLGREHGIEEERASYRARLAHAHEESLFRPSPGLHDNADRLLPSLTHDLIELFCLAAFLAGLALIAFGAHP